MGKGWKGDGGGREGKDVGRWGLGGNDEGRISKAYADLWGQQ